MMLLNFTLNGIPTTTSIPPESTLLAALRDTLLPRLMSGELSIADMAAK